MSTYYPDLRTTADVLLNSSSSSQLWLYQHLQPTVFPPRPLISQEDLVTGIAYNNRMSAVRRFFCLLVLFDFLLTLLIWLICMMIVSGSGDIVHILTDQVLHYHIQKSVFDLVMSAFSRFLFLQSIYGCLRISHWWAVAISTFLTCIFLIAKVFVFNWAAANQPILQVMLILVSFVLSWGEVWFLDFRVLPQEMQAREYLQAANLYNTSDQNPLLRSAGIYPPVPEDMPESIANFYSPKESLAGESDDDCDSAHIRPVDGAYIEDDEYIKRGKDMLSSAWSLINAKDWREVIRSHNGDVIESLQLPKGNKLFKFTGRFHFPPSFLLEELFTRVDQLTMWNKTVIESKRLKVIGQNCDITYQVSASGGGGVIKSRDFVMLRHWEIKDGAYVLAACSITLSSMPQGVHVRGENGPGCFVIKPVDSDEGWCDFQWLINTNLKLKTWLPQAALDSGFLNFINQYVSHLRDYAANLHKTGVLK